MLENARLKAVAGFEAAGEPDDAMVLGVDTDVFVDGRMLGQPADRAEAEERLRLLSGREHEVLSGVCLIGPRAAGIPGAPLRERSGLSRSAVTFRDLDDADASRPISTPRSGGGGPAGTRSRASDRC